jgi:hypothetical protein
MSILAPMRPTSCGNPRMKMDIRREQKPTPSYVTLSPELILNQSTIKMLII